MAMEQTNFACRKSKHLSLPDCTPSNFSPHIPPSLLLCRNPERIWVRCQANVLPANKSRPVHPRPRCSLLIPLWIWLNVTAPKFLSHSLFHAHCVHLPVLLPANLYGAACPVKSKLEVPFNLWSLHCNNKQFSACSPLPLSLSLLPTIPSLTTPVGSFWLIM